ncbi:MAG TPA: hypothetical protein VFA26_15135 [Gemmataceae bacterium]|nr:hypothetical protein [Gemmataceae bacterium]
MLSLSGLLPLGAGQPAAAPPASEPAAASPRLADACRFLGWAAVYAIVAASVIRPADDWDLWWHLRTGQWVVEHGAVPQTDPFSQYGQGKSWVAYSWLCEVGLYGLYQGLGLAGIVLFRAALCFAIVASIHRLIIKRVRRFLPAVALLAAAVITLTPLLNERPWLFTLLFATWTLDVLLDLRDGRLSWCGWLLPLAYVFWANLHIQFVYGLFLLGLGCAAPLIDRLIGKNDTLRGAAVFGSRHWWKLVALTAACTAATLVNPYHVGVYGVVLEFGTQMGVFTLVAEMTAPDFRDRSHWVLLGLALTAAFVLGRRRSISAFDVLLLAATAYFAFRSQRDVWFLTLASLAVLARPSASGAAADDGERWTVRRVALLAGVALAVMAVVGLVRGLPWGGLEKGVAVRFPVEAAAAVEEGGYAGPLFNDYNWGGYLIWRLPNLPVAMDGRANLHGDDRLRRSCNTWSGAKGWDDDPELAAANVVLGDAHGALASLLRRDGRFRVVHEDDVAIVFVRRGPEAAAPAGK